MNTSTPSSTPTADPRRWVALTALSLATLMVVLDASIINIALPNAQTDLGLSNDSRQWAVTAYALTFGGLLLLGGRIADVLGRKRVLLVGLIGFAAASALGGVAWDGPSLYVARGLQGIFAAAIAPAALAIVVVLFTDAQERAKAFGIYGAVQGAGGATGLLLGGSLTNLLGWRSTLLINLPIALIAVLIATVTITEHHARSSRSARFDLPGAILATLGPAALVGGLSALEQAHESGPALAIGLFVAAALLIAAFIRRQRRAAEPMLPLQLITDRTRTLGLTGSLLVGAGMFGMFLYLAYYLQTTLSYDPLAAGLAILPFSIALIVMTQIVARLMERIGVRTPLLVGMTLTTIGAILLTTIDGSPAWFGGTLAASLLMGTGLGLVFVPLNAVILTGVAPEDSGITSAMLNAAQQIGGAIGVAVLSVLFATQMAAAGADELAGYRITFIGTAVAFALALAAFALLPRVRATQNSDSISMSH